MTLAIRDKTWIRSSFLLAGNNTADQTEAFWRYYTEADASFIDNRLGGNFPINQFPGFTRYADIRRSGVNLANRDTQALGLEGLQTGENIGVGRYWYEAYQKNAQDIHIQFGVPEYNGMFSFFTSFFDAGAATLASEGRASFSYYIGRIAGLALGAATLVAFPWLLVGFVGMTTYRFLANEPSSKYYYLRPSMALYWNRVNFIANNIAVNMGIVPRVFREDEKMTGESGGQERRFDDKLNNFLYEKGGGIFKEGGGIDIYAISNKAQRMADKRRMLMQQIVETENGTSQSMLSQLQAFITGDRKYRINDDGGSTIEEYLKQYHTSGFGDIEHKSNDPNLARLTNGTDISMLKAEQAPGKEETLSVTPSGSNFKTVWKATKGANGEDIQVKEPGFFTRFAQFYTANRRDGNAFVTFRVEHTGPASESFQSTVKDSDIQSKINGYSSSARNLRFSLSEGNTGFAVVDEIKGAVASMAAGVLDGFQVSGILALAGSAFVDIPKHFEASSASFPKMSYKIELRTPYGNKLSRFMNLYVPLSCLLAGALPLSTGKQSYTAPFICQVYDRGRCQSKLAMITSLSVERGAGVMGYNNKMECLGIDVTFEITDLSSVMHAPIEPGSLLPWKNILDDDNPFMDYMAVLGNLSMSDQYYPSNKLMLNLTRKREYYDSFFSASSIANSLENVWGIRQVGLLLGVVANNTSR